MATEAPTYDLVLLLSADAEEQRRKKIMGEVESAISAAGGSIERDDDWGRRPLAYEIRHQADAEYHLLQFHAPPTLIDELSHTLRITDGVLRFRVIKVRPGTPPAPSSPPPVVVAAQSSGHSAGAPGRDGPEPSSAAAEPTAAPDAGATTEPGDETGPEAPEPTTEASEPEAPEPTAEGGEDSEPATEDSGES